jgi:hypothetical protein
MAIIILFFQEKRVSHELTRNIKVLDGIKNIIKVRPILFIVLIDLLLLVFVNIYYQVLFFPKISSLGLEVKYFGIMDVLTLGMTSLFLILVRKITIKSDKFRLLIYSLIPGVVFVIFGLSNTLVVAVVFGMLFDPVWHIRRHIIPTITNKYFASHNRSLNISSMSFVSNMGAAILLPISISLFNKSYLFSFIPLVLIITLLAFYPGKSKN